MPDQDAVFLLGVFAATTATVLLSIEFGYRIGRAMHRRSEEEKESPVAAMGGTILGLVAFLLAFTFSIASSRLDTRKQLVRDEAGAIETTHRLAAFLEGPDRDATRALLADYLKQRLATFAERSEAATVRLMEASDRTHRELWTIAAAHGRRELNSDVAALYVQSLTEMINLHHQRVSIGLQTRIPSGVWWSLCALTVIGMLGMGYQVGVAGSKRSSAGVALALAFALVGAMIAGLDHPLTSSRLVSHQPLANALARIEAAAPETTP